MTEKENPTPPLDAARQENNNVNLSAGINYLSTAVGAGGCLLIIAIIVIALLAFGVTTLDRIGSIFNASSAPSANVISSQTVVESILPMGQLVTVGAQFAKVNVNVTVNQGVLNLCAYNVNHAVQGTIEAGIDVTKIEQDALRYDSAREIYVLTLPPTQLTSCRIDFIQQYDWSVSTCNPDWDSARLLANYVTTTQFRNDSLEGGILTRAESEVRLVLGGLVRLLTGHPVEIVFQQADANTLPSSCEPEIPAGWVYDSAANTWSK